MSSIKGEVLWKLELMKAKVNLKAPEHESALSYNITKMYERNSNAALKLMGSKSFYV